LPTCVIDDNGIENDALLGKTFLFAGDEQFKQDFPINDIADQVLAEIKKSLEDETSRNSIFESDNKQIRVLIEVILPVQRIGIFGSNYDIYPLMRIGQEMDGKYR
jgi:hypothetical protein